MPWTFFNSSGQRLQAFGFVAATQAEMEAASSTTAYVTPGRAHHHPGTAKAWLYIPTDGSITTGASNSYNITQLTDTNTGVRNIIIATDFANTTYSPQGSGDLGGGKIGVTIISAGEVLLQTYNAAGTLTDYASAFSAHGDQ